MAVINTKCICGQPVTIRTGDDCKSTFRPDRKQAVYPEDRQDINYNVLRCKSCDECLHDTVAEFKKEWTGKFTFS